MNFLRSALLLAILAASAAAQAQPSAIGWDMADSLTAQVASCASAQMPPEARGRARAMHNPDPGSYVYRQLERMLRADPVSCPGIAAAAVARLRALVGEPERADGPGGFVALARIAAEEGLGMPRDPVLADRYGRIEWLFDNEAREIPRWTEAQQQDWLTRPETIALLEAYVARHRYVQRQPRLLAELRLRRDVPGYDPERALALFEQAGAHDRYAEVLSDGVHMPRDYRRAFEPMFRLGMFDMFEPQERLILRIGRRAAAVARTPEERGEALRILFAGSINDRDGSCAQLPPQRRHFDGAPVVPLAHGEAQQIRENLSDDYDATSSPMIRLAPGRSSCAP